MECSLNMKEVDSWASTSMHSTRRTDKDMKDHEMYELRNQIYSEPVDDFCQRGSYVRKFS